MKKILAVLALTIGLAGCVIDDGYGYYDDYYSPGYSNGYGYGYANSYTTVNNYRYYDNNRRRWVTRNHADQKRYWDNNRKHTDRNNWNRRPDRDRHDAKPNTPSREWRKNSNQNNRRIEQHQNTSRRPNFNRIERSRLLAPAERNFENRSESRRRDNNSR